MWKDCTMIKKIKETDWWEVSYLIIYAIIFSKEFLQTTMFPITWPLGLGYVFALMSGGYVIAKFLFHNTYTKKEMILAILVLIAFCVPAFTTDYTFLFWTGCLIVGAKDVDFNKILKVYLVLGITFMVAAFAASQGGVIEDLVYETARGESVVFRHSYGIIYPTDFAAHLFFIVLATIELYEERMTLASKIWLCALVAISVYGTSHAQTTTLCLVIFAGLCVIVQYLRKYMSVVERLSRWCPIACATFFLVLAYCYNPEREWMMTLNRILTTRLEIAKNAFDLYNPKLFGQYIPEIGAGIEQGWKVDYFFLDDSYIKILLKYGIVLFVVLLVMLYKISKNAAYKEHYVLAMIMVIISVHSIMEHRLVDMAYNPIILAMFASVMKREQADGRKKCIEKTVKVG